jgi:hypothetical protein
LDLIFFRTALGLAIHYWAARERKLQLLPPYDDNSGRIR